MKKQTTKSTDFYPIFDVDAVEEVFGAKDIYKMMPKYEDIPQEYKMNFHNPAFEFICGWFYTGLKNPEFVPKEGVDPEKALKHIATIMVSYAPKHEHKMAGCAWLLDQWFISYKNKK